jgi:uncharacterized membrane protein
MPIGSSKAKEVAEEFRTVVLGRGGVLDVMLPPVVFLVANALAGSSAAMLAALVTSGGLVLFRLLRHQSVVYALFGLGASLLALILAQVLQRAEVFFLPDMITNLALAAGSLLSVALRRPLVAWTSHLVRRWPRDWYWHPRVRPAYAEVTLAWAVYFLAQALLQLSVFQLREAAYLAALGLFTGWPATVVLLILTYLYGTWRLARLAGPSVDEFRTQAAPPWTGQRRGF